MPLEIRGYEKESQASSLCVKKEMEIEYTLDPEAINITFIL